jgi:hypothetical protein
MVSEPVSGGASGARRVPAVPGGSEALDEADRALVGEVEPSLAAGLALKRWWDDVDSRNAYARRFEIVSEKNRPDSSYGFFDEAPIPGRRLPVMGVVQEQLYDAPKSPKGYGTVAAEWMSRQAREFVLRYFLRVSDFREPEAYVEPGERRSLGPLDQLSWCAAEEDTRRGFGYEQVYFERLDGTVGKFPEAERHAILDLREVARSYRWIVLKVQIFDFKFSFKLRRPGSPEVVVPLAEESYLVLSPELIVDQEKPEPGVLGRFGFGYAFLRDPAAGGLLAYGPGQFAAAFQTIHFKVLDSGEIRVCMAFVLDRPTRILNVSVNPVDWTLRMADWMSFGLSSRLLAPMKGALDRVRGGGVDPVFGSIDLAGALSGGLTERDLCISREQLERTFMVRHFLQHYQTIVGSLLTWRSIPDWSDEAALPEWVRRGGDV